MALVKKDCILEKDFCGMRQVVLRAQIVDHHLKAYCATCSASAETQGTRSTSERLHHFPWAAYFLFKFNSDTTFL